MNNFSNFFNEVDIKKNYSCLICGPDTSDLSKHFVKNYLFVDLNKNLYSKKLLIKSFILFFNLIFKFFPSYKNFRLILTLSLVTPLIIEKKISRIICFLDYSKIGKELKKILGKKVVLIGLQHSMRASHMDRKKLITGYDKYYLWDDYKLKNKITNCEFINFGALKSYIVLEREKKWSCLNNEFKKSKRIILISSIGEISFDFEKKFLNNLSKEKKINKILSIYNQFKNKKIKLNIRDRQALEFFMLCITLQKIVKKNNFNLTIIGRFENSLLEENEKSSKRLKKEKLFLDYFFDEYNLISLDIYKRLIHSLKNKDSLFITNISSLGKEMLALNYKVIFFSFLNFRLNPDYFDKKSLFCCLDYNNKIFSKKILSLFSLDFKSFEFEKKKCKRGFLSFQPTKEKLFEFLQETGLNLKKRRI